MELQKCFEICAVGVPVADFCFIRLIHSGKSMVKFGITYLDGIEHKFVYRRDKPVNANMQFDGKPLERVARKSFWWQVIRMYLIENGLIYQYDPSTDSPVTDEGRESEIWQRVIEDSLKRDWRAVLGGNLRIQ